MQESTLVRMARLQRDIQRELDRWHRKYARIVTKTNRAFHAGHLTYEEAARIRQQIASWRDR